MTNLPLASVLGETNVVQPEASDLMEALDLSMHTVITDFLNTAALEDNALQLKLGAVVETLIDQFGVAAKRKSITGLGLWIVKHLITLQQGTVGVESTEQAGSIFWIELPQA